MKVKTKRDHDNMNIFTEQDSLNRSQSRIREGLNLLGSNIVETSL